MRLFDHIDLRVRNLAEADPFYAIILPALGFPMRFEEKECVSYDAVSDHPKPGTCQIGHGLRSGATQEKTLIPLLPF